MDKWGLIHCAKANATSTELFCSIALYNHVILSTDAEGHFTRSCIVKTSVLPQTSITKQPRRENNFITQGNNQRRVITINCILSFEKASAKHRKAISLVSTLSQSFFY